MKSLNEIHEMEKSENWLEAIKFLEERLKNNPLEFESILRLSFLLWYLEVEKGPMGHNVNTDEFPKRLNELYSSTKDAFKDNVEYLYRIGLMMNLFPYTFGDGWDEWQKTGSNMLKKAAKGDPDNLWVNTANRSQVGISSVEYKILDQVITRDRLEKELKGRGFLSSYYLGWGWFKEH